jgi:hypothetical protein
MLKGAPMERRWSVSERQGCHLWWQAAHLACMEGWAWNSALSLLLLCGTHRNLWAWIWVWVPTHMGQLVSPVSGGGII